MFQPTQADVRRFFCTAHAKQQADQPLDAMQTLAALWIAQHPEYHIDLTDVEAAVARNYEHASPGGRSNPFLHLSMHLSISEQCSIDQPRGIRQAVELLAARHNGLHHAHHIVMECLAATLEQARSTNQLPDGNAYLACVQRRATRG